MHEGWVGLIAHVIQVVQKVLILGGVGVQVTEGVEEGVRAGGEGLGKKNQSKNTRLIEKQKVGGKECFVP